MGHQDIVELSSAEITLGKTAARWSNVAGAIGVLGLVAGFGLAASGADGWTHFRHAWLWAYMYFLSISLGALFLVLIFHLTRAGWGVVLRRVAEVVAANLLLPLPLLAIPILLGLSDLYPWARPEAAHDHLLVLKSAWLNAPFFIARFAVCYAVWGFLAWYFLSRSREQDRTGDWRQTMAMESMSAPGMIAFALTVTVCAFDFLMSLDPHWYSTIFGVYYFAGCVVGYFAFQPILTWVLQRSGKLRTAVSTEHYHDMGKLTFAFVVFWAYIAFSQYMLIWFGNIPEETEWYLKRFTGGWVNVSWLILFGHFAIPFLVLVSRAPKRRPLALVIAASWLLVIHAVDLYWLVMPGSRIGEGRVPFGLIDLACFFSVAGFFLAFVFRRLGSQALVPVQDPRLRESLGFENA